MMSRTRFFILKRSAGDSAALKKTALWDLHKSLNATMGGFAGWDMPMIYKGHSIPDSVAWTRQGNDKRLTNTEKKS